MVSFHRLRVAASRNAREAAAMECAFEGNDAVAFFALAVEMAADDLDARFHRFAAGTAEEYGVGEGRIYQPLGKLLLQRHLVEVGAVPQHRRLILQGFGD